VRRVWDDVMESVRRRKRTPHAILGHAEVSDVRGNELVLGFNSVMARTFANAQDAERVLREALTEVVGGTWRVTAEVLKPGAPSPGSSSGAGGPGGGGSPAPRGRSSGGPVDVSSVADLPSADDEDMPEGGSGGAHDPVALLAQGLGAHVIGERDKA
ncbi:MAG TPA: hypothetical protein VLR26_05205, partial [Frankiaceae bacterium]|nr:hypothetical protein [Frankiaceae bacterium]